ncbi:MAG: bifunctional lysylphosphatidylglycerol flippase/synthetase MprF [Stenotrophobium sp.]
MSEPEQAGDRGIRDWLMPAFTLLIFCAALWVLNRSLHHIHWSHVLAQLEGTPSLSVLLSALCVAGSYTMLTLYDFLALRVIGHRLPYPRVAKTSFIAYGVGHSVGLSSISGGSIRLRRYADDGLSALEIGGVIVLCTLTFALGVTTLLGFSLIFEAGQAETALHLNHGAARVAGELVLAGVAGYLLFTAVRRAAITVNGRRFALPRLRYSARQTLVSCADLGFAAASLYFLMPAGIHLSYLAFVGIYVLAIAAGVVSNVPGGLGVFEGVLVLLLPEVPKEKLLGAVVLYRILYYLLPLALGLVLLATGEWEAQRDKMLRPWRLARRWLDALIPQVMAALVFLSGALLLFSGSLPARSARISWLSDVLPLGVIEVSHLVGSAVGASLLILARGLYRKLDGAWWLTQALLAGGIVASLLRGIDYEDAIVLGVISFLLWLARARFYRRAPLLAQRFSPIWFVNVALVLAAAIWVGLTSYKHVEYGNHLWWEFAFSADAPRMLRASLVAVALVAFFALWQLLGASRPRQGLPSEQDMDDAHKCLAGAAEAGARIALLGDKQFLFSEQKDAFIMYQRSGRSWIALGDPVGNPERYETLAWKFRELCDRHGGWPVFYEVSATQLPLCLDLGLALIKLGEEARVPLTGFTLEGSKRAELRQAKRKGEQRDGLSFQLLSQDEVAAKMEQLREVSDDWLMSKTVSEKGFSVGNFDPDYLRNFRVGVALKDGEIVAFANLWESEQEVSVDLMRYSVQAPRGVMDYLFVELMLWSCAGGKQWFNLGMAPLSGLEKHPLAPIWHKLGLLVHRYGEPFYNFDGLRRYKEKFGPEWRPRYLASPGGLALPSILLDTAALIAGGMKEVIFK